MKNGKAEGRPADRPRDVKDQQTCIVNCSICVAVGAFKVPEFEVISYTIGCLMTSRKATQCMQLPFPN